MQMKKWSVCAQVWLAFTLALMILGNARADSGAPELKRLERSFSLHASLDSRLEQNATLPAATAPTEHQIQTAARLLTFDFAANRLYLIYQKEISLTEAEHVFRAWRQACPAEVEVVPALVLRAHGTKRAEIFNPTELRTLLAFFKSDINPAHLALLNAPADESATSRLLSDQYGGRLIRLGLQPDEPLSAPFDSGVADASSALCRGASNDEWQETGFGREMLRKSIQARNAAAAHMTWDLAIASDDVSANHAPAPVGRDALGAAEILHFATPNLLGGFSTDLARLQRDSRPLAHDGGGYCIYEMLKRGQVYVGFYAKPFHEVVKIYQTLRAGKRPGAP